MASFDPSVISSIGERATGPATEAPFKALQLSDLTQQNQQNQIALKAQKDEQADLGYAKDYIARNNLSLSNPDDQARLVSEMATRNPKMAMAMQRDFAQNDEAQVKLRQADLEYHAARLDTMALPSEHIVETMEDMAKQGKGEQEIQAYGQKAATELFTTLSKQSVGARPVLTAEDKQAGLKMLQGDIYQNLKGFVTQSQKARTAYKDYQDKLNKESEIEHRSAGEAETARHNKAEEGFRAKEVALKEKTAGGFTGGALDVAVQDYVQHGKLPRGDAAKAKVYAGAAQYYKDHGEDAKAGVAETTSITARAKAVTALQKTVGFVDAATKTMEKQFDLAISYLDKVPRTRMPLINKAIIAGRRGIASLQDPNEVALANTMYEGLLEYAKVLGGGAQSAAQLTEGARETAVDLMKEDASPESIKEAVSAMKKGAQFKHESYTNEMNELQSLNTGQPASQTPSPAPSAAGGSPPSATGAQGAGAGPPVVQWSDLK